MRRSLSWLLVTLPLACTKAEPPPPEQEPPAPKPPSSDEAEQPPKPPRPPIKLPSFELDLSCETHGVAITTHRVELSSDPASITVDGGKAHPLETRDLGPLWSVIDSPGFRTFIDETPNEGPPHPGMKRCTLVILSPTVAVKSKQWTTADEYSTAAARARQAMLTEIGELESRTRPRP